MKWSIDLIANLVQFLQFLWKFESKHRIENNLNSDKTVPLEEKKSKVLIKLRGYKLKKQKKYKNALGNSQLMKVPEMKG